MMDIARKLFVDKETGNLVSLPDWLHLRILVPARMGAAGTTHIKFAAVEGVVQCHGHITLYRQLRQFRRWVGIGYSGDQRLGIRVPGVVNDFLGWTDFNNFSQIHTGNPVANISSGHQIVGNVDK